MDMGRSTYLVHFWGNEEDDVSASAYPCWYYAPEEKPMESAIEYYFGDKLTPDTVAYCVEIRKPNIRCHFVMDDNNMVPPALVDQYFNC